MTLYCPGPGPTLSAFPLCLAPKLKAGARPDFDSAALDPGKDKKSDQCHLDNPFFMINRHKVRFTNMEMAFS